MPQSHGEDFASNWLPFAVRVKKKIGMGNYYDIQEVDPGLLISCRAAGCADNDIKTRQLRQGRNQGTQGRNVTGNKYKTICFQLFVSSMHPKCSETDGFGYVQ